MSSGVGEGSPPSGLEVAIEWPALALLGVFLVSVGLDAAGVPLLRPSMAVLLLMTVPGGLFLTLLGFTPEHSLRWWLYAMGTSLVLVMGVVMIVNVLWLAAGLAHPLSAPVVVPTIGVLVLVLAGASRWIRPLHRRTMTFHFPTLEPWPLVFLLIPALGILAVEWLNRTGSTAPVVGILLTVALVPVAVAVGRVPPRWHPMAVGSIGVTLLYHKSLWAHYAFSGQANVVVAWKVQQWAPTAGFGTVTTSLLPNAVLFPAFARAAGVDVFTQLEVINPLIVGLIPLAVFATARGFVRSRAAVLAAALVAFAHPFYLQFPTAGRAATPVLFLALLVCVLTDGRQFALRRRSLGLLFAGGLVVSHYGASYFVLFAFLGALAFRRPFGWLVKLRTVARGKVYRADGLGEALDGPDWTGVNLLSRPFLGFYTVATLAWYLYTGGGKFHSIVRHVFQTVTAMFSGSFVGTSGSTAARLQANYGVQSIAYSKRLYLVLGGLIALGILVVVLRRLHEEARQSFPDDFVTVSATLLAVFGLSFLYPGAWGGGRPMMLVFSVSSVFAAVGLAALTQPVDRLVPRRVATWTGPRPVAPAVLSVLLAILLAVNTGLAAATVIGGVAPSNVPVQERLAESSSPQVRSVVYKAEDTAMHVWVMDHRDPTLPMYGDRITSNQQRDWYRPRITAAISPDSYYSSIKYSNSLMDLAEPGSQPGYAVLAGHNVEMNMIAVGHTGARDLHPIRADLRGRHRVYATDVTQVYLGDETGSA